MMPQVMSLIQRTFPGAGRARALGFYLAVLACGAVIGQVLGGVLVSLDLFGAFLAASGVLFSAFISIEEPISRSGGSPWFRLAWSARRVSPSELPRCFLR